MQVHVLRASVTACTHYEVQCLKDSGNSCARDSGQDANDCEICFIALGGARYPGGRHREGGCGPIPPVPSPCGQRGRGEGLGRGGCQNPPGAGGTRVGRALGAKSGELPQTFRKKPRGLEGPGSDGHVVPTTCLLRAGSPLCLSHPRSAPQGSNTSTPAQILLAV